MSLALLVALRVATERGQARGHTHVAASGLIRRIVLHVVQRSIAPRAVCVVGVPSGSASRDKTRSAAVSNPPAARKRSRLPAVIACSSRAISWRMSGSALVGPAGSAAPWPSPSCVQRFRTGRGAVCCRCARADGDDVHGENPRPERGPEGRVGRLSQWNTRSPPYSRRHRSYVCSLTPSVFSHLRRPQTAAAFDRCLPQRPDDRLRAVRRPWVFQTRHV